MDALDCRSPARCASCEHSLPRGCALEAQLAILFAPRPAQRIAALGHTRPLALLASS